MKVYSPETKKEKAIVNDDTSYGKITKRINEDGIIPTQLNESAIRESVSTSIYAHPTSGIRELYANEMSAALVAKEKYGAAPSIDVFVNYVDNKITIVGNDSLGITKQVFKNILTVLGNSSNHDRTKPGMFGMGFYAYTCLSDTITVHTYARETKERLGFVGIKGAWFKSIKPEHLETFGTKIEISFSKEDAYQIEKFVNGMAKLSRIPTTIHHIENDGTKSHHNGGQLRNFPFIIPEKKELAFTNGKDPNMLENVDLEDRFTNSDDYFKYKQFHIEDDDIEMFIKISDNFYYTDSKMTTFLADIPIELLLQDIYHLDTSLIINVKNEGKYPPTPDRERFTEKSLENLKIKIYAMLEKFINDKRFEMRNFSDVGKKKDQVNNYWLEHISPIISNHTKRDFDLVLGTKFDIQVDSTANSSGKKKVTKRLKSVWGSSSNAYNGIQMYVVGSFNTAKINGIKKYIENKQQKDGKKDTALFIKPHENVEMFYRFGAINADDFMKEHGIKPEKSTPKPKPKKVEIVFGKRNKTYKTNIDDDYFADLELVKIPKRFMGIASIGWNEHKFISIEDAEKHGVNAIELKCVMGNIPNTVFETSEGKMTFDKLCQSTKKVEMFMGIEGFENFLERIKSDETLYALLPNNISMPIFAIAALEQGMDLGIVGREFDIVGAPYTQRGLISKLVGPEIAKTLELPPFNGDESLESWVIPSIAVRTFMAAYCLMAGYKQPHLCKFLISTYFMEDERMRDYGMELTEKVFKSTNPSFKPIKYKHWGLS